MSAYEIFVLACILTMLVMFAIVFPLLIWIDWKRDVKKYGKETAYEIWRRWR